MSNIAALIAGAARQRGHLAVATLLLAALDWLCRSFVSHLYRTDVLEGFYQICGKAAACVSRELFKGFAAFHRKVYDDIRDLLG